MSKPFKLYLRPDLPSNGATAAPHKVKGDSSIRLIAEHISAGTSETRCSGSLCRVVQVSNKNVNFHK